MTTTMLPPSLHTGGEDRADGPAGEHRTLLVGVSWRTYESLLRDFQDRKTPLLTYDGGLLEIVSPLIRHEKSNWILETLTTALLEEWGIEFLCLQHATFRREDVDRGTEPDSCFYIQNVAAVEGKEEIDLTGGDPPPDLVIEVDITSPSVSKLPAYATFGVPEIWRADGESVTILLLTNGQYVASASSTVLPRLSAEKLNELYTQGRTLRRLAWLRAVREWARLP